MTDSARERIFPFAIKKSLGKTALVAGGAGFLGSHLCDLLISYGFSVICVDNLTSGSKDNIQHLLNLPSFSLVKADINSPNFTLPDEVKIDIIFHAAGLEEFPVDQNLSLETLLVNSLGTRILLEMARKKGAKFVFISSADLHQGVFSSTSLKYYFGRDPKDESTFTHNEAKRFAEALVFEYFKKYNIFAEVVRVKDLYGPRMNLQADGELNRLLKGVIYGKKLEVLGEGLKTLNPTYVLDAAQGVVKASLEGKSGEIYNLVNPDKVTTSSLAQVMREVVGGIEINFKKGSSEVEFPYHQLDLSTSEKLDWRPSTSLADGIAETIGYFRGRETPAQEPPPKPLFLQSSGGPVKGPASKKTKRFGRFLRLTIFLASLILVLITVIYPGGALIFNTYQANQSFKKTIQSLEADQPGQSVKAAERAQGSYQKASQNLQNLNWLLQIFVEREKLSTLDDFYFSGESLSKGAVSVSQALTILINQTKVTTGISEEELEDYLLKIGEGIQEARLSFEAGSSTLDSLEEEKLPASLRDDLETIRQGRALLEELIEELDNSTTT